jgi:hypothetical protein
MKITSIFKYTLSLLVKETHNTIFSKKTSNIPVDNGSSLNIPITIKIIALANITLIETSVLLLYLLVYYLIFNPPLPSLYILIEFSPNDQNTAKLFLSIKRTNIYILSNKFVLNRSILMEVRFVIFPLS